MSIKLRTPSNGSVTLSPQDTASDVVLTVPAGTSTMVTNATLPTQLNASGSAPIYACRAWVNFNGNTAAIRGSGNVSSVTRYGVGDYDVNFTTALLDTNYAYVCGHEAWTCVGPESGATFSTSALRIRSRQPSTAATLDRDLLSVVIYR